MLAVPILRGDRILGVLVIRRRTTGSFGRALPGLVGLAVFGALYFAVAWGVGSPELAELWEDGLFRPLGYASVEEYSAAVLDLTARQTRELLRIGRALPGLPLLSATMEAGELDWTKARELVRVLTPDNEEAWIALAKQVPCRVL